MITLIKAKSVITLGLSYHLEVKLSYLNVLTFNSNITQIVEKARLKNKVNSVETQAICTHLSVIHCTTGI